jgi:hypothetical protein
VRTCLQCSLMRAIWLVHPILHRLIFVREICVTFNLFGKITLKWKLNLLAWTLGRKFQYSLSYTLVILRISEMVPVSNTGWHSHWRFFIMWKMNLLAFKLEWYITVLAFVDWECLRSKIEVDTFQCLYQKQTDDRLKQFP